MQHPLTQRSFIQPALLLIGLVVLLSGLTSCSGTSQQPEEQVPQIARTFDSIALMPAQFTDAQPDSFCHDDIGDDLRSTMARHLRKKGYQAELVGNGTQQSFALDPPSPKPGNAPELIEVVPAGYDTALGIWVDHYMATNLCESYGGGGAFEVSITIALYQLPGGKELGRWHVDEWTNSASSSRDAVWWILESLAKKSLAGIP